MSLETPFRQRVLRINDLLHHSSSQRDISSAFQATIELRNGIHTMLREQSPDLRWCMYQAKKAMDEVSDHLSKLAMPRSYNNGISCVGFLFQEGPFPALLALEGLNKPTNHLYQTEWIYIREDEDSKGWLMLAELPQDGQVNPTEAL